MAAHHHGSDMPTSPRAVLYHTGTNLCTILHTTVCIAYHAATADCECVALKLVFWAGTMVGISGFCPKIMNPFLYMISKI